MMRSYAILIFFVANTSVGPTLAVAEADPRLLKKTWIAKAFIDDDGADWEILPGTEITLRLEDDGEIHGSAGCNQYSGGHHVTIKMENSTITMPPGFATTRMYCSPDETMVQEYSYLESLPRAVAYSIDNSFLELLDVSGTTVVEYESCNEDLLGITWTANSVNNGRSGVVSLRSDESTLLLNEDGSFTFSACNHFTGTYTVFSDNSTISISIQDGTDNVCPEIMEEESMLLAALQNSASYTMICDSLRLMDSSGATQAYFGYIAPPIPPSNCTGSSLEAGQILHIDDAICSAGYTFGVTKQGKLTLFRNDTSQSVIWTAKDTMGYDSYGNRLEVKESGELVFSTTNPYKNNEVWARTCSLNASKLELSENPRDSEDDIVLKFSSQWHVTEGGDEVNMDCEVFIDQDQDMIPL